MVRRRGRALRDAAMRFDHGLVFARMGRRGDQHLTVGGRALHLAELHRIGRRRRDIELEVAGDVHGRHAELRKPLGVDRGLREAQVELSEQRLCRAAQRAPALEGLFRHAAVDQDQRDPSPRRRHDQVRPQILFDEKAEIGPPVMQEAGHEARCVERDELMDHVVRQPVLHDFRGRDGARRHEHLHALLAKLSDQREDRDQFADARAMQPDQRTVGTLEGRLAVPLDQPLLDFLAAAQAAFQPEIGKGRGRRHCAAVRAQCHRQLFSHAVSTSILPSAMA